MNRPPNTLQEHTYQAADARARAEHEAFVRHLPRKRTVVLSPENDAFVRKLWSRHITEGQKEPTFSGALNDLLDLCRASTAAAATNEEFDRMVVDGIAGRRP